MAIYRRLSEPRDPFFVERRTAQLIRDLGEGSSASASTVPWGNITGSIANQLDLNQILKDKETFDFFMDN